MAEIDSFQPSAISFQPSEEHEAIQEMQDAKCKNAPGEVVSH
jgi:hypothetical protein